MTQIPDSALPPTVWQRIRQHKMLEWSLAYLGAALAIAHGAELLGHTFAWSETLQRLIMGILIVGFPLALTVAWFHGHKGLKRVTAWELMLASVLLVVGAGLLMLLVRPPAGGEARTGPGEHAIADLPAASSKHAGSNAADISLAVLPFVNLSAEKDEGYFVDGLSEELLNQIAQFRKLRVIGRTSSFAFKGRNEDLRVVGQKLGVNHLLEGSVRRLGDRLRITAQLVNVSDGSDLWSASYDRQLDDVFKVQQDIARDVAAALSVQLGIGETVRPLAGGTRNLEAYDDYLRARGLFYQLGRDQVLRSAEIYRKAVQLDPRFAQAWYGLYQALDLTLLYVPENSTATHSEMIEAGAQVIALAPESWWAQALRSRQMLAQGKWSEAEASARAAVVSAGSADIDALITYADVLSAVGRTGSAIDYLERARQADPLSLLVSGWLQLALDAAGRRDDAQAEYERSNDLAGTHSRWDWFALLRLWSRKNVSHEVVDAKFQTALARNNELPLALGRALATRLWRPEAALALVRQAFDDPANQDFARVFTITAIADHYGDRDLVLAGDRRGLLDMNGLAYTSVVWSPSESDVRSDARFKKLIRDLRLVDYWRASHLWSDHCRPLSGEDFECH